MRADGCIIRVFQLLIDMQIRYRVEAHGGRETFTKHIIWWMLLPSAIFLIYGFWMYAVQQCRVFEPQLNSLWHCKKKHFRELLFISPLHTGRAANTHLRRVEKRRQQRIHHFPMSLWSGVLLRHRFAHFSALFLISSWKGGRTADVFSIPGGILICFSFPTVGWRNQRLPPLSRVCAD